MNSFNSDDLDVDTYDYVNEFVSQDWINIDVI